jgi:hypothetical protein
LIAISLDKLKIGSTASLNVSHAVETFYYVSFKVKLRYLTAGGVTLS